MARAVGVGDVLVCCDEGNVGSSTVIVSCGGEYDSTVDGTSGPRVERYWIRALRTVRPGGDEWRRRAGAW